MNYYKNIHEWLLIGSDSIFRHIYVTQILFTEYFKYPNFKILMPRIPWQTFYTKLKPIYRLLKNTLQK